jgi:hypothetical protein
VLAALNAPLVLVSPAVAEDAVVLTFGAPPLASGVHREARSLAAEALRSDGVSVVAEERVAARMASIDREPLTDLSAARAIGFELEARWVVLVVVEARTAGESVEPGHVEVILLAGARTFRASEPVALGGLAAAIRSAVAAVLAAHTRAVVIEGSFEERGAHGEGGEQRANRDGRSGSGAGGGGVRSGGGHSGVGVDEEDRGAGAGEPEAERARGERTRAPTRGSSDAILGPTLLAALGAGGIGLGVYALLDGSCEVRGSSGVCLRGEDPNVPLGIVMTVSGILALGGAVIWLLAGDSVAPQPRIDVVLGPEGGSLAVRGRF